LTDASQADSLCRARFIHKIFSGPLSEKWTAQIGALIRVATRKQFFQRVRATEQTYRTGG